MGFSHSDNLNVISRQTFKDKAHFSFAWKNSNISICGCAMLLNLPNAKL